MLRFVVSRRTLFSSPLCSTLNGGECRVPAVSSISTCFRSVRQVGWHERSVHSSSRALGLFGQPQEDGVFKRMAKRLGWTETSKSTLRAMGYLLYIKTADGIDYNSFFKKCEMEDTFVSWFMCVELHVWMLSVRLMELGEEGKIMRNALIQAMWEDCDTKSKKLEGALASARKKQVQMLSEEFQACLLAYDEGLLSSDKVLAGALWRRFFKYKSESSPLSQSQLSQDDLYNQVVALEMLVIYVRSQYFHLSQLSREKLVKRKFNWLAFNSKLFDLVEKVNRKQAFV